MSSLNPNARNLRALVDMQRDVINDEYAYHRDWGTLCDRERKQWASNLEYKKRKYREFFDELLAALSK